MSRNNVTVNLGTIDDFTPLSRLEKLIAEARERAEKEDIRDLSLVMEYTRGYYDDIEVGGRIEGIRKETDEEYSLRTAEEERRRGITKKQRYEEYLRLEREFGKTSNEHDDTSDRGTETRASSSSKRIGSKGFRT